MANYFRNIWDSLMTAGKGLVISFRHIPSEKVTRHYPEPRDEYILPERARNRLYVNMDDCIGCDKCARACPVNCIEIDTVKAAPGEDLGITSDGKKKALWVTKFDIDMAKCCFCSLCIWPCPTECIVMTEVFEYSEPKRENLIYHFATMDNDEAADHEANWKKWEVEATSLRQKQAVERAAKQATTVSTAATSGGVKPPPYLAKPTQASLPRSEAPGTEGGLT